MKGGNLFVKRIELEVGNKKKRSLSKQSTSIQTDLLNNFNRLVTKAPCIHT